MRDGFVAGGYPCVDAVAWASCPCEWFSVFARTGEIFVARYRRRDVPFAWLEPQHVVPRLLQKKFDRALRAR